MNHKLSCQLNFLSYKNILKSDGLVAADIKIYKLMANYKYLGNEEIDIAIYNIYYKIKELLPALLDKKL